MSFSEFDVTRRTRKGNFLKQIDQLIDWNSIEKAISVDYAPVCDAARRTAYSELLLFKMLRFLQSPHAINRNLERWFKR